MSTTQTIIATGMTCNHCVQSVTGELQKIEAVEDVRIELETGAITVESASELDRDRLREAIRAAGYEPAD